MVEFEDGFSERMAQLEHEDLEQYERDVLKNSSYSYDAENPNYVDEFQSKLNVLMDLVRGCINDFQRTPPLNENGSETPTTDLQQPLSFIDDVASCSHSDLASETTGEQLSDEELSDSAEMMDLNGIQNNDDSSNSEIVTDLKDFKVSESPINSHSLVNPSHQKPLTSMDSGFKVLSIYCNHMASKSNNILEMRPKQSNDMSVEVYYDLFFNWKKNLEEVNYIGGEESYIDDFVYGLELKLGMKVWGYEWKPRTLYGTFCRAKFEETMISWNEQDECEVELPMVSMKLHLDNIFGDVQPIEEHQVEETDCSIYGKMVEFNKMSILSPSDLQLKKEYHDIAVMGNVELNEIQEVFAEKLEPFITIRLPFYIEYVNDITLFDPGGNILYAMSCSGGMFPGLCGIAHGTCDNVVEGVDLCKILMKGDTYDVYNEMSKSKLTSKGFNYGVKYGKDTVNEAATQGSNGHESRFSLIPNDQNLKTFKLFKQEEYESQLQCIGSELNLNHSQVYGANMSSVNYVIWSKRPFVDIHVRIGALAQMCSAYYQTAPRLRNGYDIGPRNANIYFTAANMQVRAHRDCFSKSWFEEANSMLMRKFLYCWALSLDRLIIELKLLSIFGSMISLWPPYNFKGVGGLLMFTIDPGGCFLLYNGCVYSEFNIEQEDYSLRTTMLTMGIKASTHMIRNRIAYGCGIERLLDRALSANGGHVNVQCIGAVFVGIHAHSVRCCPFDPGGNLSYQIAGTILETYALSFILLIIQRDIFFISIWDMGQCALIVYILVDKDGFEGMGRKILATVITGSIKDNKFKSKANGMSIHSLIHIMVLFCSYSMHLGGLLDNSTHLDGFSRSTVLRSYYVVPYGCGVPSACKNNVASILLSDASLHCHTYYLSLCELDHVAMQMAQMLQMSMADVFGKNVMERDACDAYNEFCEMVRPIPTYFQYKKPSWNESSCVSITSANVVAEVEGISTMAWFKKLVSIMKVALGKNVIKDIDHEVFDKRSKLRTHVDGILMFVFDPGGSLSFQMDCDALKFDIRFQHIVALHYDVVVISAEEKNTLQAVIVHFWSTCSCFKHVKACKVSLSSKCGMFSFLFYMVCCSLKTNGCPISALVLALFHVSCGSYLMWQYHIQNCRDKQLLPLCCHLVSFLAFQNPCCVFCCSVLMLSLVIVWALTNAMKGAAISKMFVFRPP